MFKLRTNLLLFLSGISILLVSCNMNEENLTEKAVKIHDQILTVDTHCDTPMRLLRSGFNLGEKHDSREGGGKFDFPRMKEGGLDAIFFAVFIGQGDRTEEGNEKARNYVMEIFDAILTSVDENKDIAAIATSPEDAYEIEDKGKRAIFIGLENGYPIGNDLSLIEKYYGMGARYITLCHTGNNDICDSSTDSDGPEHNGLSDFGINVVKEMNRLGMMVDVSHISDPAFYDVLEISNAPVIASHSCARTLCDNPRNLTDDMLRKLVENGGVIQICFVSEYLKTPEPFPERDSAKYALREKYKNFQNLSDTEMDSARAEWYAIDREFPPELATVADLVNHIDHIVDLIGIDHVGIGTDFDGGGALKDCYDVSEMGNVTLELLKRGYTPKDIEKIWGGNLMRVFRKVRDIAEKES
ncbi:MAG: dipeptidase [Bacteroidetes bacterium]|nr:dipeptidase [Bacteroidota bacterium]